MLFQTPPNPNASPVLAISQPAHAWISGQLLRAWAKPLDEPLLLAGEQHDIGWLDWERAPSFDPATGRPHLFRQVGAATHAPMWTQGVDRALGAWGTRVALLVSRHGDVIYNRNADRHRLVQADARAAAAFSATQAPLQAAWTQALGLDEATLRHDTDLIAFADTLSLALCGELKSPLTLHVPGPKTLRLEQTAPNSFTLHPWPFRTPTLTVETEARALPDGGRLASEAEMQAWLASPIRTILRVALRPA